MKNQPHFLLIITDQHRADWLGCAGHPVVKTPNIDAIAARGTQFNRFHVASPVCMPNRASLMTGRYPSVHGLRHNGNYLSKDTVTFADVLLEGGYNTASIGKSHLQPFTNKAAESRVSDDMLGIYDEARFSDGQNYSFEEPSNFETDTFFAYPRPYYGFETVDMVTGHGDSISGHYMQWLRAQGTDVEALFDIRNELPHNYTCIQAYRTPIPEALYYTSYIKNKAVAYLASRQGNTKPFFAFVSFPDPHHPFNPPGKYWDMYNPDDFDVPLVYADQTNPIPPLQFAYTEFTVGRNPITPQTAYMTDKRKIQESMALTAGMITMIDDAVGEIIDQLKICDLYDNTVIIFTSDHGDYLGDFNLMLKGALPFNSITQVPFIWSDPVDRQARATNVLGSTLDIAPTVIKRAGLKPYWGIQGIDITDNIFGSDELRSDLLIEYEDNMPKLGFPKAPFFRSLLTDDYRFTLYKDMSFGELYNLKTDPDEKHNLFDDPDYKMIKSDLMARLVQQMMCAIDKSPRAKRRA